MVLVFLILKLPTSPTSIDGNWVVAISCLLLSKYVNTVTSFPSSANPGNSLRSKGT